MNKHDLENNEKNERGELDASAVPEKVVDPNDSENTFSSQPEKNGEEDMEERVGENAEEEKSAEDLEHLKKMSEVSLVHNPMKFIGIVVAVACVILFLTIIFSGSSHSSAFSSPDQNMLTSNSTTISQNEKKLAILEKENPMASAHSDAGNLGGNKKTADENNENKNFLGFSQNSDALAANTKAMQARRSAPTLMYSAFGSNNSGSENGIENNPAHASNLLSSSSNGLDNTDAQNEGGASGLVGDSPFDQFANHQSADSDVVTATKMQHPDTTIAEGEIIPATLETAIDSDLPGMVRAVITSPVYAYVGEKPLVPAGSRLIGQYTSLSSNGAASERVFVIWNRILTPDGTSIMINSPGSDALGRAGMMADEIDVHFWKMFGTASLLSIMGATTATAGVSPSEQPNSADAYRQSIASAMQQSAQNSLNQNLNIQPTLNIHQGDSVTVFVAHDLDLYSVLHAG